MRFCSIYHHVYVVLFDGDLPSVDTSGPIRKHIYRGLVSNNLADHLSLAYSLTNT